MTSEPTPTPQPTATGSCLCSAIQYTTTAAPMASVICHCTNCRKCTGSPFATNLFFQKPSVRITHGLDVLRSYADTDTIRNVTVTRSFCGNCGSTLFAESTGHPGALVVATGSLDGGLEDEVVRPKREFFCKEKRTWMEGGEREELDAL